MICVDQTGQTDLTFPDQPMTLTTLHLNLSEKRNPIARKPLLAGLFSAWLTASAVSAAGANVGNSQPVLTRVSPHAQTVAAVADQLW